MYGLLSKRFFHFSIRCSINGVLENVMNKGSSSLKMCCLLLGYTILLTGLIAVRLVQRAHL